MGENLEKKNRTRNPAWINILDFFSQDQKDIFVVPVYQRYYTWQEKNAKQLMEDIKGLVEGKYEGKYSDHFLGIVIYLEIAAGTFENELSIIDGQQRIVTLYLVIQAIKEKLEKLGRSDDVEDIEQIYLYTKGHRPTSKLKLKPQVSDDGVYEKIITGDFKNLTSNDKQTNIYKNYIFIKKYLDNELGNYDAMEILFILNNLSIVVIPVQESDDPQKIFETINATGEKLTASDLIRNFILMPIATDMQETYYDNYWKEIEKYISNDSKKLEDFFRFFITARTRVLPNKNAVYQCFVDWYNKERNEKCMTIEAILEEIVTYARYYNALYILDIDQVDPELRNAVKEFRAMPSDMASPIFMEIYSLTEKTNEQGEALVKKCQLSEIISLTHIYYMRRALCDLDTSPITRMFPGLLKDVINECNGNYTDLIEIYKKNLVNKNKGKAMYMPNDDTLQNVIANANMYSIKLATRIFLEKLENENNPAPVDLSSLNVEHIMPQTESEEWESALGIDGEEYEKNVNRLGNLTLVAAHDNSAMGNSPWEKKKGILKQTGHLKINQELLKKEEWNLNEINNRTKELIEDIKRLYPYFENKSESYIQIPIRLKKQGISATALFDTNTGSVRVEEGSTLRMRSSNNDVRQGTDEKRQELIDEGIIQEINGVLTFIKDYDFEPLTSNKTSLSYTASFLLDESLNGWEMWEDEYGIPLKNHEEIYKKFNHNQNN